MLNGIQILRAMAALGVVLFHSAIYLQGVRETTLFVDFFTHSFGQGVLLFFSISGFVLWPVGNNPRPLEFLTRRLLRIYPPFLLLCAIALTLKWALNIGVYDLVDTLKAMSLLPFGSIPYPLSVEWSLVYEMFFYWVVFGICFFSNERTRQWLLGGWLVFLIACALVIPQATVSLPTVNQVALSAISLPFVFGALSRIFFERFKHRLTLNIKVFVNLLALSVVSLLVANLVDTSPIAYLFWGLGFSVITFIAAIHSQGKGNAALRLLGKWGDCSYGTYLIHFQAVGAYVRMMQHAGLGVNALFASTVLFALLVGGIFGWTEFKFHRWMTTRKSRCIYVPYRLDNETPKVPQFPSP